MSAWGAGNFENDDAMDFLGGLGQFQPGQLASVFARAESGDYLEAPESGVIVAAAEAVAASRGAASGSAPQAIIDWAGKNGANVPPDMVSLAQRAVQRVRTNSELRDLWLEADGLNEWSAALHDLENRLAG